MLTKILRHCVLVVVGILSAHSTAYAQGNVVFVPPLAPTNGYPTNLVIIHWPITTSNYSQIVTVPMQPILGPIFPRPWTSGDWDPRFALPPGVNGEVLCMASVGADLYLGGRFTRVGGLATGGLARWDGVQWSIVGEGIEGEVFALAAQGNSLYVGGRFRTLGNVSATNIARWTRKGWQTLGEGISDSSPLDTPQYVSAILVRGRDVYVGGDFHLAGGVSANNVAKWNGRRWSSLGEGVGRAIVANSYLAEVHALEWCHGELYVGGRFSSAGLTWTTNLARWNGRQWRDAGAGVVGGSTTWGAVYALARQGTNLLVGGSFTQAGDIAVTNLARWNGRNWSPLGDGVDGEEVRDILVHGAQAYVAGSFEHAGTEATANVACWNGRQWTSLNSGVRGFASALGVRRGRIYVGGYFGLAGGMPAAFVARWHRDTWSAIFLPENEVALQHGNPAYWPPPTNAVIGEVMAVAAQGSNAYVGGRIFSAGLVPVNNIAHWNGAHWSDVGGGIPNGTVWNIAVTGSNVYVSGSFVLPDIGATNLALWNGIRWSALNNADPGSEEELRPLPDSKHSLSMAANPQKLWVSGQMLIRGRSTYASAEWDGTNWSLISASTGDYLRGWTLMTANASNFFGAYAQTLPASSHDLFRWDGEDWSTLTSSPITGSLHAMTLQTSNLFLAGEQLIWDTSATPTNLLRWDGSNWSSVEFSINEASRVTDLTATPNRLYAIGSFTNVNGLPMQGVARWSGYGWSPLGSGITRGNQPPGWDFIRAAAGNSLVFFGGNIRKAGELPAFNFAVWNESLTPVVNGPPPWPPIPFPSPGLPIPPAY